ncbi:MAG: VWA domain-containing protein, partial [Alphaproteobacteria bacterium]|nr:VWA domain-containing protein [Alphaproteobacteria bacterium]
MACMSHPLEGFIRALRASDVPVSVREATEAYRALEAVGYADRQFLKDALGIVMAKTHDEKLVFEACFDLYFARAELADSAAAQAARRQAQGEAAESLADMLLAGDRAALAQAMEAAGAAVGVQEIRFFTQRGYFTRRMLDAMGLREMEERIQQLRQAGEVGSTGQADALERGRAYLLGEARAYVERQHEIFARPASARLREEFLERTRLSALDERDYARMHNLVRRMAKRLAAKHSLHKKRRRRGQLDVRRTLRRNMGRDAIPFEVIWRMRKIDRPSVVAICDVSRSVAAAARFLLLFLHSLNELLRDMRAFAFSDSLIEVTEVLD